MPDYFFHVAIEIAADPQNELNSSPAPNFSHFFHALKPFTGRPRSQRVPKYDRRPHKSLQYTTSQLREYPPRAREDSRFVRPSSPNDHRFDTVYLDGVDMTSPSEDSPSQGKNGQPDIVTKGIGSTPTTTYLKGHFSPTDNDDMTTSSWGIVHLYRDADPTPCLTLTSSRPYQASDLWSDSPRATPVKTPHDPPSDGDCTTLCILAVPSYMTPADFLAFVGEKTRDAVSHFRMVRTQRQNRYMVLMKFRDGKFARNWQAEWNGKVWNAMEPETCHVVFLKTVELVATSPAANEGSYPQVNGDPFVSKPIAPPTPSLVELPTCPVCLERMDETTGLLTIPCQHVFHCTCLQKWSGGGCPVCRYTHDDFSSGIGKKHKKTKRVAADGTAYEYEVDDGALECETCHEDGGSLWQCLICGKVGCGRYEGKHAYKHYEESGHLFAMDLTSKRVWDYGGDGYVHRIMVEEGSATKDGVEVGVREVGADSDFGDAKNDHVENLALEYTHLLTSQLESQRVYFEEIVERAADKASEAAKRAERAERDAAEAIERLRKLEAENDFVTRGRVPELEKERERLTTKVRKLEDMAKDINSRYLEERASAKGLLSRVQHLEGSEIAALRSKIQSLEEDNATKDLLMEGLRDEHRDAMIQVSAERQLREMVQRGEIEQDELDGAEVTVGKKPLTRSERLKERLRVEQEVRGGKKGKGKAKSAAKAVGPAGSDDHAAVEDAAPSPSSTMTTLLRKLVGAQGQDPVSKGDAWSDDEAAKLVEEMRIKMVRLGLLKNVAPAPPAAEASRADQIPSQPTTAAHAGEALRSTGAETAPREATSSDTKTRKGRKGKH